MKKEDIPEKDNSAVHPEPQEAGQPIAGEPLKEADAPLSPCKKRKKGFFRHCKGTCFGLVKTFFWLIAWSCVGVTVAILLLWVRLLHSPISLEQFSPLLTEALSEDGQEVILKKPVLSMTKQGIFSLHAGELMLSSRYTTEGNPLPSGVEPNRYHIQDVDIQISTAALATWKLRPSEIIVDGIDLKLQPDFNKPIEDRKGDECKVPETMSEGIVECPPVAVKAVDADTKTPLIEVPNPQVAGNSTESLKLPDLAMIFDRLFADESWGGYLNRIAVNHVGLETTLLDKRTLSLAQGRLNIGRYNKEMTVSLRGNVTLGEVVLPLMAEVHYDRKQDDLKAKIGLEPSVLDSKTLPELDAISPLPFKGMVAAQFDVHLAQDETLQSFSGTARIDDMAMMLPSLHTPQQHAEMFRTKKNIPLSPFEGNIQRLELTTSYNREKNEALLQTQFKSPDFGEIHAEFKAVSLNRFLWEYKESPFDFTAFLEAKKLNYDGLFEKSLDVQKSTFSGEFYHSAKRFTLSEAHINAGEVDLSAGGEVVWGDGQFSDQGRGLSKEGLRTALNFQLSNLSKPNLLAVWPVKIPGSARTWVVENLKKADFGIAQGEATFDNTFTLDMVLPFSGVEAQYNPPMTPITAGKGTLQLTPKDLEIDFDIAKVGQLQLTKSTFKIPDLVADIPDANILLNVKGKVIDLLSLLDEEPLKFITKSGIDKSTTAGDVTGKVTLDFPLIQDLKNEDLKLQAEANTKGFMLSVGNKDPKADKNKGYHVSNGDFNVKANMQTIEAKGKGRVNGLAGSLAWQEKIDLPADTKMPSTFLKADFDKMTIKDLLNFGIDVGLFGEGEIKPNVEVNLYKGQLSQLKAQADLTKSILKLPVSDWILEEGIPKQIKITGFQTPEGNMQFDLMDLEAGKTKILSRKVLFNEKGVSEINFDRINLSYLADLKGVYRLLPDGGHYFRGKGKYLNLTSLFSPIPTATSLKPPVTGKAEKLPIKKSDPFARFDVGVTVDQFIFMSDIQAKNVHLTAQTKGSPAYEVVGVVEPVNDKKANSSYSWQKFPENDTLFQFKAKNVGGLLRTFDLYESLYKGDVDIKAEKDFYGNMEGHLKIKDGLVIGAPALAHLLSLISLDGIVGILDDEGLILESLETGFAKKGTVFTFWDGLIKAPALGISFQGGVNQKSKILDLEGTIIPFYMVNSLLNDIPLLGTIVGRRETEGLLGVNYSMEGSMDKPDMSINPLSIITPGFLRSIFDEF